MHQTVPIRFRILGSLECWDADERIHVGGPVSERVLVTLLLEPQRVLPVHRLIEAVWDQDAPATAAHQVRKAVAELRQRIPEGRTLIATDGPGYRASVTLEQLDLLQFTDALQRARDHTAAGRTAEATALLREALALWRGPVLSGSGGAVVDAASASLEERRMTAVEQLFDLRLEAGESSELIAEIRAAIRDNPLREALRGQLMLALYRSGRQAEALEEYGTIRAVLDEELGIQPGTSLRELHQAILRNDPALTGTAPQTPAAPAVSGGRSTLPYDLRDFTGREEELHKLLGFIEDADGTGPLIVAIDGMGGSGKTSLAVRAAHQLTDRYPDAQLHLDLRGYTPDEEPLAPAAAAEALLRMLGIPGERIPDDPQGRLALWRATMIKHRMILLLDNVVDESQVRPLLASPTSTVVLVTSRALLVDLDAAHSISLGTMAPPDSIALVESIIGDRRAQAEPEAVAELADLSGHLPLALRIAAARLRKRPRWSVRYLVDRLRDDTHRLAELSAGERSVEVTLRLSYEGLDASYRKSFRLLGQYPGAELDVYTAAALLDLGTRDAEDVLEYLLDMHLVQQHEPGRYAFHDLVRSFAHMLSRTRHSGGTGEFSEEAAGAVRRLMQYSLTASDVACDLLFPGRVRMPRPTPSSAPELAPLSTPEAARDWFEREQDSLLAAIALAFRRDLDREVALLAANVVFHLDLRGRLDEFLALCHTAVAAARRLGEADLLRLSLSNLAVACWKRGRFEDGIAAAVEAHELAVDIGDRRGQAKDTGVLGLLLATTGRFDEALPRLEQSIALKRELGAERAEAESLSNISTVHMERGDFPEAVRTATRSIDLARKIGALEKELVGLGDLAQVQLAMGEVETAARTLAVARERAPGVVAPAERAVLLVLSAEAEDRLGHGEQVLHWVEEALATKGLEDAPVREAAVWNAAGRFFRRGGDHERALALHRQAHASAVRLGHQVEEAYALDGLARSLASLGDSAEAAERAAAAQEAFRAMGIPGRVRLGE
ncbi:AfsR/SARP family transcriptional regulator [Streptomyces humi]|uniref:AfsR/SARP family transcriptional regulator n=1 Tax=Streptomyces humi TaxID=1428620 RepID=UPI0006287253|nr:BTAD domain-containing putative transcriptional regulator [Streptomyces humi]